MILEKSEKRINRFLKLYPWFAGITGDLLFYIAIDTLFLTLVKDFSAAEIVSLASFSQLACIALQFPVLLIIKKIGNTASYRVGALCLLLSALLITFGRSYFLVLLGRLFHDLMFIFRSASIVALENNLALADKKEDFIRIRTSANTVYSVITMLISFVVSFLFNLNYYLPMALCIATCALGFLLSLAMRDCSDFDKIPRKREVRTNARVRVGGFIVMMIVFYALFCPLVNHSQSEGKLFIQENLFLSFDAEKVALIIGAIVCVSRVIRVLSNLVFAKLYKRYQAKMGVILPTLLFLSISFLFFGAMIPSILLGIIVMAAGYTIILFVRDPFKLYVQDVVLASTPKEKHQTLLTTLEFSVKVTGAGMGLAFSAILLGYPLAVVMGIMLAISVFEIVLSLSLYKAALRARSNISA